MARLDSLFTYVLVLVCVVWLSGCSSSAVEDQATATSADHGHDHEDHDRASDSNASHDHADHDHSAANQEADAEAFAELSAEDRQMVELQKICPVTDEALGSMGTPIKVRVGDRDVFICCEGCREDLLENADKYLAKLSL